MEAASAATLRAAMERRFVAEAAARVAILRGAEAGAEPCRVRVLSGPEAVPRGLHEMTTLHDPELLFGLFLLFGDVYATVHLPRGCFWTGSAVVAVVMPPLTWTRDGHVLAHARSLGETALRWERCRSMVLNRKVREGLLVPSLVQHIWDFLEVEWSAEKDFDHIIQESNGMAQIDSAAVEVGVETDCDSVIYSEHGMSTYARADMDLYIVAQGDAAAQRLAEMALRRLRHVSTQRHQELALEEENAEPAEYRCDDKRLMLRTPNTVTLLGRYPLRPVQLVLRYVKTLQQLLLFADLDCTAAAFDGSHLYGTQRFIDAVRHRANFVPRLMLQNRADTPARIAKYMRRGFDAVFQGMNATQAGIPRHLRHQQALRAAMHQALQQEPEVVTALRRLQSCLADDDTLRGKPFLCPHIFDRGWAECVEVFLSRRHMETEHTRYDDVSLPRGPFITPGFWRFYLERLDEVWRQRGRERLGALVDEEAFGVVCAKDLTEERWASWGLV